MGIILKVRDLFDTYADAKFGFVGKDMETGEFNYYSYFDKDGNFLGHNYFDKFDPDSQLCGILQNSMYHCSYKREKYSEKLPAELEMLVNDLINKHIKYNNENGYPLNSLLHNIKNLSIQYSDGLSLWGTKSFDAAYRQGENTIFLTTTEASWKEMTEVEKEKAIDNLLHEIGHMKVSNESYDLEKETVRIQTGFIVSTMNVRKSETRNGDIVLDSSYERHFNDTGMVILEEIFNELELRKIKPNYQFAYPKYGELLDTISDGKLQKARYDGMLEEYYESLNKIIPKKEKADKLLETMYEGVRDEYARKQAFDLLEEYMQAKEKNLINNADESR